METRKGPGLIRVDRSMAPALRRARAGRSPSNLRPGPLGSCRPWSRSGGWARMKSVRVPVRCS